MSRYIAFGTGCMITLIGCVVSQLLDLRIDTRVSSLVMVALLALVITFGRQLFLEHKQWMIPLLERLRSFFSTFPIPRLSWRTSRGTAWTQRKKALQSQLADLGEEL